MTQRHPIARIAQLALGCVLLLVAAAIAPLPGPGGVFPMAAGLGLILRNSRRARGRFARAKRRWPRIGGVVDLAMRRRSALRRRARAKARGNAAARGGAAARRGAATRRGGVAR